MINKFHEKYRFLSNFYPATVYYKGVAFPTVEHAYQSAKTFDAKIIIAISLLPADKAGKSKRIGRKLKRRSDWKDIKLEVIENLIRQKFDQVSLRKKLVQTGTEELVEGNYWHDNYYGNCECPRCENIKGENHLGKLLMKVRKNI